MTVDRLRNFQCDEARRVQAIIRRDQADQNRDDIRRLAELKIRDGLSVDLLDTVIEPTPEWLGQGEHVSFTAPVPERSAKVVTTRRRVVTPIVKRMHNAGKISDDQFSACRWYQAMWEQGGLVGRYKTNFISLTSGTSSSGNGTTQHPMAQLECEADARTLFREARSKVSPRFVSIFDLVVLADMSLRVSATKSRVDNSRLLGRFQAASDAVASFIRSTQTDSYHNLELKGS